MQVLAEGQPIRHGIYGPGVVVESDSDRTTVDFDEHGTRKFVTSIWSAELTGDPPVKLVRRRARKPRKPAAPRFLAAVGK